MRLDFVGRVESLEHDWRRLLLAMTPAAVKLTPLQRRALIPEAVVTPATTGVAGAAGAETAAAGIKAAAAGPSIGPPVAVASKTASAATRPAAAAKAASKLEAAGATKTFSKTAVTAASFYSTTAVATAAAGTAGTEPLRLRVGPAHDAHRQPVAVKGGPWGAQQQQREQQRGTTATAAGATAAGGTSFGSGPPEGPPFTLEQELEVCRRYLQDFVCFGYGLPRACIEHAEAVY